MSLIKEQNDAFLQSLEHDLMKEIEKIDEACKPKEDPKPTVKKLREIRTQFFEKTISSSNKP